MLTNEIKADLVKKAFDARNGSYSPYSRFQVGAALLTSGGEIFLGANIENASYGATICAERTAAVKAASSGKREFIAIAVVGSQEGSTNDEMAYAYPCGICRQFLREFLPPSGDIVILVAKTPDQFLETTLNALLPHSFGPSDLDYLHRSSES
ncbi:MAG: cytidine deaminase [Clostridiales bacterium]|jgi:cytidine deaminase|nr:cytidine deaminase [Clostridiales bacterium]MCK9349943.1 cytidine deaminase [Clostridiales bacterium]MDD3418828.1 cytidine deaminase [Eubacteriales bacterium]MDD3540526.1 cytidine deaminase [Eubacteriales bacterium]MDY0119719.1 cytidine deaminase [Clostridia bacterium]